MPSRVTVPVDSVHVKGGAPLLTDITLPSVMPMPSVPPAAEQQQQQQQWQNRRSSTISSGTATEPAKAPTSIIRNKSRDVLASRGGRVTFARDTATTSRDDQQRRFRQSPTPSSSRYRRQKGDDWEHHTSSSNETDRHRKQPVRAKTPATSRSTGSRTTTNSASTSSSTRKSEHACRNVLESALRDQFDTSFTGSQGLGTLISTREAAAAAGAATADVGGGDAMATKVGASTKKYAKEDNEGSNSRSNTRVRENIMPNTNTVVPARPASSRSRRALGNNERLFKDRYGTDIDNALSKHQRERPDRPIREYHKMTDEEKVRELDKVGSLLSRLGICDNFKDGASAVASLSSGPSQNGEIYNRSNSLGRKQVSSSGPSQQSALSRTSGTGEIDESRTTLGNTSRHSGRSRAVLSENKDIDESRTTLGDGQNECIGKTNDKILDDCQQIIGTDHRGRCPNNDTIDESRTTMDLGECPNDTTTDSTTRLDQSSVVFDFGGGDVEARSSSKSGTDSVETYQSTTRQKSIARRHVSEMDIEDNEDTDDDEMIDSPPRHQEDEAEDIHHYQPGFTRLEDSHFTCNADAGTIADTQGAASVARPKLLFQSQTPQFEKERANHNLDYEAKQTNAGQHNLRPYDDKISQEINDTTRSSEATSQSAALLSKQNRTQSSRRVRGGSVQRQSGDASCSPVEMPRSAVKEPFGGGDLINGYSHHHESPDNNIQPASFQSPVGSFASNRKRLASTSGKRGADMQRSRLLHKDEGLYGGDIDEDHDMIDQIDDDDSFNRECPSEQIDSPSQLICSSIRSPPSGFGGDTPSFLAGASQSPILRYDSDLSMMQNAEAEFRRQKSPDLRSPPLFGGGGYGKRRQEKSQQISQDDYSQFSQRSKSPEIDKGINKEIDRNDSPGLESFNNMDIDDDGSESGGSSSDGDEAKRRFNNRNEKNGLGEKKIGSTNERKVLDDTVESVNCTVLPRRDRTRKDRGMEYSRDVAPADIHMKNGQSYRLDPLRVCRPVGKNDKSHKRASSVNTPIRQRSNTRSLSRNRRGASRSPPTMSIPDPLSFFERRTAERLEVVADWVMDEDLRGNKSAKKGGDDSDSAGFYSDDESEANGGDISRGVVLSMSIQQIVGVTLKLLVTNGASCKSKNHRSTSPYESQAKISPKKLDGGTILLVRNKEELDEWERALREQTCYSVMNHAAISSTERKRSKMAGKCAGFDIVITTYDALKTKESSFALDGLGRAIYEDSQGGWYESRSQNGPRTCEHLSVLHQLEWNRVIMIDVLGRQSYTAKPGTARYKAAVALKSNSRFIFFEKEKESTGHLEDSFKDSKKQLCAVATALHMDEDEATGLIEGNDVVDFRDVRETEETYNPENSRSILDDYDDSRYEDAQGYCGADSYRCHSDSELL